MSCTGIDATAAAHPSRFPRQSRRSGWKVKARTGTSSARCSLASKLRELNPILRGWANYYRHCGYAGRMFTRLDWYTGTRIVRRLRKKRPKARSCDIWAAYQPSSPRPTRRLWREGLVEQHMLAWTPSAASVSHGWKA
ncbi:group II intron maturase-specific domain-containing protein [Mesorhizobium sp.]|uniref:group II intron maturase-specific domain-containing protein n=1 Tax=Mesorhizobium sp. TaxID=1871066 RepID=UPI002579E466|nr:group II intron maturase-specific domain-containing protein [Mesorhizobium sp.]